MSSAIIVKKRKATEDLVESTENLNKCSDEQIPADLDENKKQSQDKEKQSLPLVAEYASSDDE